MIDIYTSLHNHSEYSTAALRFADAICNIPKCLDWSYKNNLRGYAITDHQCISGFVDMEQHINKMNLERAFTYIFGDEIYLMSQEEDNLHLEENEIKKPHYWHFLLNVLDEEGLHQLYEISARAWKRSYTWHGILRRPTYYSDLEEIIGKNPGHIIGSTACIGGYLPNCILNNNPKEAINFLKWNNQVFGKDNFFLECQPSYKDNAEQIRVNSELWELHNKYDIPIIVTTDSHFMRPEDRIIHSAFLKSKDGGDSREPEKFYQTTYLFTPKELRKELYNSSFSDDQIDILFQTTNGISERIQPIKLKKTTRVPALPELPQFEIKNIFEKYYSEYEFINYYANSKDIYERYYFYQIEKGLKNFIDTHDKVDLKKYLSQINIEMEQVKGLSNIFNGRMADYFTVVQKVIDLIWNEGNSLVGIGRGSAGAYVTNYLLRITGINPLDKSIDPDFYPWWRFCSIARSESIFDIDIDIQSFKKEQIIQAIKNYFGERKVVQVVTWGKLTSKTALERAGKGLNIPDDSIGYLKSLIPVKRGYIYSLNDCIYGNKEKGREKVPSFITEIKKFPNLLETALALEGMIVSSGVHAGALNILQGDFTETGSIMVSSNGAIISQFDLHQAEYCGDLKIDLLSIDALECIRTCIDLLIDAGYMDWQGTLRDTYNYYLRYDVLEKNNRKMWKLLPNMINAFQYDTRAGQEALRKIGATSLNELTIANGLMRLAVPNGEQPMDMYVRYRNNINEWYQDMKDYGLNQEEINIFKELLGKYYGVLTSQETMMICLMDKRVCGFNLKEADRARKAVAKKNAEALKSTEDLLYKKGKECGRSQEFLDYLWREQIEMSKSYAFAFSHSHEYSTECLQELNMYWKYPKIFWNGAVIITQAQTNDERENSSTSINYGKIAQSIYKARNNNIKVSPPNINISKVSFGVDEESNSILYGLSCIAGINIPISNQIISNRPYDSFKSFLDKNIYEGSLVTESKIISLIKAGCFDCFCPNRSLVLKHYIAYKTPTKQSITMANFNNISQFVPIPDSLTRPIKFKNYVISRTFLYGNHPKFKSKKLYYLPTNANIQSYFESEIKPRLQEGTDYWAENNMTIIVDKSLDKLLKNTTEELKKYLNRPEILDQYRKGLMRQKYNEIIKGNDNPNHWSMEALSYYSEEHELSNVNFEKYNISNFSDLPQDPVFVVNNWRGREFRRYEISQIAGVILDRSDTRHILTILDPEDNVINCKFNGDHYGFLKMQISEVVNGKKEVKEKSWLGRGNLIILTGYRRGENDFVVKGYKNSVFRHKAQLITKIHDNGDIDIKSYRYGYEEDGIISY